MTRLIFENGTADRMKSELLNESIELETAGVIFAEPVKIKETEWKLLVREFLLVPQDAYSIRAEDQIELTPKFMATVIKKARISNQSLIFVHTHPWQGNVSASSVDIRGESILMPTLFKRIPNIPHGRLVLGPDGYDALLYVSEQQTSRMKIIDVGQTIDDLGQEQGESSLSPNSKYDRQIRAFGEDGHKKIASLKIAIVGLGGTGSVVAQELAHLGVESFILMDPDILELTNLNRVVGSTADDVGIPKIKIAEEMIRKINPRVSIISIQDSVIKNDVAKELISADLIFSCTDTQGSRAMINYISYQYFIPCIDMGVSIHVAEGSVKDIVGRIQMIGPGLACLICSNILDPEIVRQDFMSEEERQSDPYIVGGGNTPQPAVISLNSTVASLAVSMFLGAVTKAPFRARYQVYKADTGTIRSVISEADPKCVVCSVSGLLGRGNSWPLLGRIS
jgi:molybdopterin/thiamine biosynthesis adenylyltransferase